MNSPIYDGSDVTGQGFKSFLKHCADLGASDILIQSGDYAWAQIHGRQIRMTTAIIQDAQLQQMVGTYWGQDALMAIRGGSTADRSFQLTGVPDGLDRGATLRFRVNIVQARVNRIEQGISITMRTIPQGLPDIEQMGIEDDLLDELYPAKGLVMVCGPTGSGKTTLQAGVYKRAAALMPNRKIITAEDPVEFVLGGNHCNGPQPAQSEIGKDSKSFAESLRAALRRAPSIVGIGEVRDLETCEAAIEVGTTGHLCYCTLHTDSVAETINRVIQMYPAAAQPAVASRLLGNLRVVIVQRLLKTVDGKRTAIREYQVFTRELRERLEQHSFEKWASVLKKGLESEKATLEDKAWALYVDGKIEASEYIELAGMKDFRDRSKQLDMGVTH